MTDEKGTPDENRVERPSRRQPEDLSPEERQERLRRFIWEPGDITIIKHPRNIIDPPPVPVRRRTARSDDESKAEGQARPAPE